MNKYTIVYIFMTLLLVFSACRYDEKEVVVPLNPVTFPEPDKPHDPVEPQDTLKPDNPEPPVTPQDTLKPADPKPEPDPEPVVLYTITYLNYDSTLLQSSEVAVDTWPTFYGATPTRPDDENYTYIFKGWKPRVAYVVGPATYIATFSKEKKTTTTPSNPGNGGGIQTPTAVDLGLPSGTLWADMNLSEGGGGFGPGDGDYFAWGECHTKNAYTWLNYKHCYGTEDSMKKYCTDKHFGKVDNLVTLLPADDAAQELWGGNWYVPTKADFDELQKYCTWKWTSRGGVNGYEITGNAIASSIFLPAVGCKRGGTVDGENIDGFYWTSSLFDLPNHASYLRFSAAYHFDNYEFRYCGMAIRPVYKTGR